MTPDRGQQVKEVVQQAWETDPGELRASFDHGCTDDPRLRSQVEALLASDENMGEFLAGPALAAMAKNRAYDNRRWIDRSAAGTPSGLFASRAARAGPWAAWCDDCAPAEVSLLPSGEVRGKRAEPVRPERIGRRHSHEQPLRSLIGFLLVTIQEF